MQNRGGWERAEVEGGLLCSHWAPNELLSGPTPQETERTCFRAGWAVLTVKACLPAAHTH